MDKSLAVYSLAKGGDWLLSMLTGRNYIEQLSVLHPDFFLISGGGNDIVGARRLAAILKQQTGYTTTTGYRDELAANEWARSLRDKANKTVLVRNEHFFNIGCQYLSKDFFVLLMFFHLQYYFILKGILDGGKTGVSKFPDITILTQGYDFPIPNDDKKGILLLNPAKWFIPVVRSFFWATEHG